MSTKSKNKPKQQTLLGGMHLYGDEGPKNRRDKRGREANAWRHDLEEDFDDEAQEGNAA